MLCPEVWEFKAPRHHFHVEESRLEKDTVPSTIKNHYFNHSVSVVFADFKSCPAMLKESLQIDSDYYKVADVPVSQLISSEFIEAFIKRGELTILSINTRIDVDNCIAITPAGHLILSLKTQDYQRLGIEGKPSYFNRKRPTRHIVTINLKEEIFKPGKQYYERVRRCLEENLDQKFSLIFAWDPPGNSLCPSSVASWFHNQGFKVSLCQQKIHQTKSQSVSIPRLENCNIDRVFEWIGIHSLGGQVDGSEDDYVNSYSCPSPAAVGNVEFIELTGFITMQRVVRIFETIRQLVQAGEKSFSWLSLHVHGFADSPVSWDLKEHTCFMDGDNSYTMVFKPTGEYFIQRSLSSNNKPRIKQ